MIGGAGTFGFKGQSQASSVKKWSRDDRGLNLESRKKARIRPFEGVRKGLWEKLAGRGGEGAVGADSSCGGTAPSWRGV